MNKFKNTQGQYYLNGLFFEKSFDKETVLYTLKDQDHEGFPSIHRLYLETFDPTEYRFATAYFANMKHFRLLSETTWFPEHLTQMRSDLQAALKSEAWLRIISLARTGGKESFLADKYLLEGLEKAKGALKNKIGTTLAGKNLTQYGASQELIDADIKRLLS